MSLSRLLRASVTVALLGALAVAAWLGLRYLAADGVSTIDAMVVGVSAFVLATLVAFSKA